MKLTTLGIVFLLLCTSAFGQCPIIPTPSGYSPINGYYSVPDTLKVNARELIPTTFDYLKEELARQSIVLENTKESGDLRILKVDHGSEHGYEMNIDKKIVITHKSDEGAFYAVNSLLQMFIYQEGKPVIQKCFINDEPRFDWRGLHLDVSRHFFTVEEVKNFIDLMALYKFNKFHWHLTDDQGWRIEIKKYPKLTSIGAFRDSTVIGHFSDEPRAYEVQNYGGFYTQEDIKEVVAYAQSKFIDVVPEIEMPGHSRAALAAYPEYSCTGKAQEVPGLWGVFDDIYCSKEESILFMQDILDEVLWLFPSEYIHIGGDEAPKVRWEKCRKCKKVMKKNKLHDTHELQSYFIQRMDKYLTERGKKLIGWDEILEGGLSPNAAVMSWRGEAGGIEAAKQGHEVVMSPTTFCYFDYYQSPHDIEPLAIGGYLPLEKVYRYDPIPEGLTKEQEKFILGGQANLWTEYMGTMEHVEYMAYPRSLALIQSLWCQNKPDYQTFLNTYLAYHEGYLTLHEVNFSKSIHYPELIIERAKGGINVRFKGVTEDIIFNVVKIENSLGIDTSTHRMALNDTLFIPRDEDSDRDIKLIVRIDGFEGQATYDLLAHSELGLNVSCNPAPHPKYDNNGSLNLVDGIIAGEKWSGSDWLGFRESKFEIVMDLEKSDNINVVEIGFLENNGSWIYLPKNVNFYVSENGTDWEKVKDVSMGVGFSRDEAYFMDVIGSYLKIEVEALDEIPAGNGGAGSTPWTFIDEIEILYRAEWK